MKLLGMEADFNFSLNIVMIILIKIRIYFISVQLFLETIHKANKKK